MTWRGCDRNCHRFAIVRQFQRLRHFTQNHRNAIRQIYPANSRIPVPMIASQPSLTGECTFAQLNLQRNRRSSFTFAATLLLICVAFQLSGANWPMWRYDASRTAESPQKLPDDLNLIWSRQLPKPIPAFKDVRLQFDRSYEPIVNGKRLFVASGREDCVTAYDTDTGKQLWRFYANGPVRLAPVAWQGRVLFGSDDGVFYCVRASTGQLAWKFKAVPSDRKLIGNKRLISVWPIRGGPVLKDGRVYFAAGVWPFEGVFIYCLDPATGKKIWLNDSSGHIYGQQPHNAVAIGGIAPQGYLLIDGDDLVVPSSNAYPGRFDLKTGKLKEFNLPAAGRLPGGWYASIPGPSAQKKTKRKSLLADLGVNVVRHEDRMRTAGKSEIRTTIRAGNQEFRFTNGVPGITNKFDPNKLDGKTIHSMIAADNKLFISTLKGNLHVYGTPRKELRPTELRPTLRSRDRRSRSPRSTATSQALLDKSGASLRTSLSRLGYAIFLGAPSSATVHHLVDSTHWRIVVVESDPELVESLRSTLASKSKYGDRIAIWEADPATFEMPPYFADLIFVPAGIKVSDSDRKRISNSIRPYGGKLIEESGWKVTTREGALPGSTNYDGDFTVSPDELVKAPLGILWFDDTLGLFKRAPQPKFIDGVMVSVDKEWLDPTNRKNGKDYRLLPPRFTDVYTGRVLSDLETAHLKRQSFAKVDLETVQPSQYRPATQKNDWKPNAPKAGFRTNPLTGKKEPRTFPKSYGCDGGFDYGNIYTMRSGTAAFYDKRVDSGTINISGPRSGCTSSIIPANGVLNLPYFYKGCTCSYPLPTGLAMISLPETQEQWTTWGATPAKRLTGQIRRIGINLGAPADRMTESGTLWLDHPSAGGPSPEIRIETVPAQPKHYYRHAVWMKGGNGRPWVAASGVEGIESVKVHGLKPGAYRVSLTFANPSAQERSFDIRIQDRVRSQGLRLDKAMFAKTKVYYDIRSEGSIQINLEAQTGTTQLSGIEIVAMELANE